MDDVRLIILSSAGNLLSSCLPLWRPCGSGLVITNQSCANTIIFFGKPMALGGRGPKGVEQYMERYIRLYRDELAQAELSELKKIAISEPTVRRNLPDGGGFDEWALPLGPITDRLIAARDRIVRRFLKDTETSDIQWPTQFQGEIFRLKKYRTSDWFPPHVDVVDYATSRRFLAFIWYVKSPISGGETRFLPKGPVIKPSRGDCLVFPPLWTYPHVGEKVEGEKIVLSSYLHYC